MQDITWRGVAELIGVGAVVASLIFVGLQMRQSQDIAMAENIFSGNSDRLAMNLAITENPEIWVKGNAGEILTIRGPIQNGKNWKRVHQKHAER